MIFGRTFSRLVWLAVVIFGASTLGRAQSGLSLDPDENVQVVYAVYGGVKYDKTNSHYVNVTDKVTTLLNKSAAGFPVTEVSLTGKQTTDLVQSLIVVYNYEQESYFYNIVEGAGNVSLDALKAWAKAHRSAQIGSSITSISDDFHVVFAAYGVGDTFINVTEPIKTLLHDQPDGFLVTETAMGGDPHPGWGKVIIIIFDDSSHRHFYSLLNVGSRVSKDALLQVEKTN